MAGSTQAAWALVGLLLVSGCGKKNRTDGGGDEAAEAPALTPENYVPPEVYPIASYDVPSAEMAVDPPIVLAGNVGLDMPAAFELTESPRTVTPLAKYTMPYRGLEEGLSLTEGTRPKFLVGFPMNVRFALKTAGGDGQMVVVVGLIDKAVDGQSADIVEKAHKCTLGSVSAPFGTGKSDTEGLARFQAKLVIPESCLKNGEATEMLLYVFANPDGSVRPASGDAKKIVVLDSAGAASGGVCIKQDPASDECQNSFLIDKSPGVNLRLSAFAGENSVGIVQAADPLATVQKDGRVPRPMITTTTTYYVEGLPAGAPEGASYSVKFDYALCTDQVKDKTRASNVACDGENPWVPLHSLHGLAPDDPDLVTKSLVTEVKALRTGDVPNGLSTPLDAIDGGYRTIASDLGGPWAYHQKFVIRACGTLYKNGEIVLEANLDTQATGGDPQADNCLLFPLLLANERVDNATTCDKTASSGGAALLVDDAHCRDGRTVTGTTATEDSDAFALTSSPFENAITLPSGATQVKRSETGRIVLAPQVVTYSSTWTDSRGVGNIIRVTSSIGGGMTMSPLALSFRAGAGTVIDGFWGQAFPLWEARADAVLDMTGRDKHYFETYFGILKAKIAGSRISLGNSFAYEIPLNQIIGSLNKKKKVKSKKAKPKKSTTKKKRVEFERSNESEEGSALFVQEFCAKVSFTAGPVPMKTDICGEIGLFLSVGVEGSVAAPAEDEAEDFPGGLRVARAALYFIPSIAADAGVGVGPSVGIASVGIKGSATLAKVSNPNVLAARFGNYTVNVGRTPILGMRSDVGFTSDLEAEYLGGKIEAFAKIEVPRWCGSWCTFGTASFTEYTKELFSWDPPLTSKISLSSIDLGSKKWDPVALTDPVGRPVKIGPKEALLPVNDTMLYGAVASRATEYLLLVYKSGAVTVMGFRGGITETPWFIPSTSSEPGAFLYMTEDGDLQLRNSAGKIFWRTNTGGNPGAIASLETDGNFVVRNASGVTLWESSMRGNQRCPSTFDNWRVGTKNCSANGTFYATYKGDTKFGVYRAADNSVVWENDLKAPWAATGVVYDGGKIKAGRVARKVEFHDLYTTNPPIAGHQGWTWWIRNDGKLALLQSTDANGAAALNTIWENP